MQSSKYVPNDSTIGSLTQSRLESFRTDSIGKRLTSSLESIRNPYQQTLPLKFPKNRIRRGCNQHILAQTQDASFKAHIRTQASRNRQFVHPPQRLNRSKGAFHRIGRQSGTGFLGDLCFMHSRSLENFDSIQASSAKYNIQPRQKVQQKRHFGLKAAIQISKNPILIGETNKKLHNMNYEKILQESRVRRYYGQGFKPNLQWKINRSKERLNFELKHNNANTKKSYKQKRILTPLESGQKSKLQTTQSLKRPNGKTKTYKQMYDSRKKVFQ